MLPVLSVLLSVLLPLLLPTVSPLLLSGCMTGGSCCSVITLSLSMTPPLNVAPQLLLRAPLSQLLLPLLLPPQLLLPLLPLFQLPPPLLSPSSLSQLLPPLLLLNLGPPVTVSRRAKSPNSSSIMRRPSESMLCAGIMIVTGMPW
jgi:hypothetical protein